MEAIVPHQSLTADASWGVHGDPTLLMEAAQKLRFGTEMGVYRSHPPGEYAMFGLARLLDAIAFSMHIDGAEIAHHVLKYLLPSVRTDARRA